MTAIAYTSPFIPVEWIAAHGLQPLWLRPRAARGGAALAAARGVCPYAGAVVDAAESGIEASALVLTTTCDQMRYASALLESKGHYPVFLLNVPSTWQTDEARALYLAELRRLGRFLEMHGGKPPNSADLAREMLAYEQAREALRSVGSALSARRFAEAAVALRGPLESVSPLKPDAPPDGIALAVLGGPLLEADYEFFDAIERAGGRVALDATEGGERTMPKKFDPRKIDADPLRELADAYFGAIPDVFRRPNAALYEWLACELAARQVRGIVFRRYVWCDLWHAELQRLKRWTDLPVLDLDAGDDDVAAPNRMQGRLEAFLEMLA
jgi:benzoyl-CoA reductase/2-hydroxyglutaryl-CoA dehydratase subunit BcrC/BadD/HgdB